MIRPICSARLCSLQSSRRGIFQLSHRRAFHSAHTRKEDPRLQDIGRVLDNEYAVIKEKYDTPKNAIILAHGLLGFDELRLAGRFLPGIQYWRGISDALSKKGIEVIVAAVPPSGSIEARAARLANDIAQKAQGKAVNIIAHSMVRPKPLFIFDVLADTVAGVNQSVSVERTQLNVFSGLDSRYMISRLKPDNVKVLSLTTIATPHRGSAFADYMFDTIGPHQIRRLYRIMEYFGLETGAFSQLTRKYMLEEFNDKTPDLEGIKYYSYGASLEPSSWSVFALSHSIIKQREHSVNDGLVSVASSQWGDYKGTLIGVSHLDLINWTNRLKWFFWELTGSKRNFNAIAFYLDITEHHHFETKRLNHPVLFFADPEYLDMLAKEGL